MTISYFLIFSHSIKYIFHEYCVADIVNLMKKMNISLIHMFLKVDKAEQILIRAIT